MVILCLKYMQVLQMINYVIWGCADFYYSYDYQIIINFLIINEIYKVSQVAS